MTVTTALDDASVNQLVRLDRELETVLTSFDSSYAWNDVFLTPRVRESFETLGILQFENADPEEQDRALGLA